MCLLPPCLIFSVGGPYFNSLFFSENIFSEGALCVISEFVMYYGSHMDQDTSNELNEFV